MDTIVRQEPSTISVEGGKVVIHGPAGCRVTFAPDAAVITSDRLLRAGLLAKRQEQEGEPIQIIQVD